MPRDGHCRRGSRHQCERRQLHAAWQRDPFRSGRGKECRPQRHRVHRRRTQRAGPLQLHLRILREGRPAPAEQTGAGIADQERRHGWTGPPRPAHGRPRPRHRGRAENPARCRERPAWPVRRVPGGRSFGVAEQAARYAGLGRTYPARQRERDSRFFHQRPPPGKISRQAERPARALRRKRSPLSPSPPARTKTSPPPASSPTCAC